jgi:hypothetical protein
MSAREIKELVKDHRRNFQRNNDEDQSIDTLDNLLKGDKIKKRRVHSFTALKG